LKWFTSATLILRKGHGNVLNVVTFTPSSIGRFENNPRRKLKLLNSAIRRGFFGAARGKKHV
jgi:hypothetical protein